MRFIIFVIDDKTERAAGNEMAAIDAFNEKLEKTGTGSLRAGSATAKLPLSLTTAQMQGWLRRVPSTQPSNTTAASG